MEAKKMKTLCKKDIPEKSIRITAQSGEVKSALFMSTPTRQVEGYHRTADVEGLTFYKETSSGVSFVGFDYGVPNEIYEISKPVIVNYNGEDVQICNDCLCRNKH